MKKLLLHKIRLVLVILFTLTNCKGKVECTVDKENAGSLNYNIQEAACFIHKHLGDKSPKLELVENALTLEEKYMLKLGLISNGPFEKKDSIHSDTLDVGKMINFALKNDIKLTYSQLYDIYEAETEYLEFIGLVDSIQTMKTEQK